MLRITKNRVAPFGRASDKSRKSHNETLSEFARIPTGHAGFWAKFPFGTAGIDRAVMSVVKGECMKNTTANFWKVAAVAAALLMFGCGPGFRPDSENGSGSDFIRIGDMVFHHSQLERDVRPSSMTGFSRAKSEPWKNGVVPVRFKFAVTAAERALFFDACNEWSKVANIKCVPHSGQEDRIDVARKNDGCWSELGRGPGIFGSATNMNLAPACWSKGVIMHELGHALGFLHEHQRPDRDMYVKINKKNIKDEEDAFDRISSGKRLGAYDYDSIMHYGAKYFSKSANLNTIEPVPGIDINRLGSGQRDARLSALDAEGAIAIYGPPSGMGGVPATPPPLAGNPAPVAPAPPAGYRNMLMAEQTMMPDERLYSDDGRSVFIYQLDGNLVLYRDQLPVWASDTFHTPGVTKLQGDGNLVIYDSVGAAVWSSQTGDNPGAQLYVQGDGNVVIYQDGEALWNTGTAE